MLGVPGMVADGRLPTPIRSALRVTTSLPLPFGILKDLARRPARAGQAVSRPAIRSFIAHLSIVPSHLQLPALS